MSLLLIFIAAKRGGAIYTFGFGVACVCARRPYEGLRSLVAIADGVTLAQTVRNLPVGAANDNAVAPSWHEIGR